MIKLLESIDIKLVLDSFTNLESSIQWTDYGQKKQAGLQYKHGDDPWTSVVGKSKGDELSYNLLNPCFSNTIFDEIITKYNLTRTRFMWIGPNSCYSMHKDSTPRIHIPIITNPECYFVFKKGVIQHLLPGYVYWTNTREFHTFINCSETPRLHLIGVVEQ